MPEGQRPTVATTWTIRSISVRTRDGPERLEQVYRRLLEDPQEPARRDAPPPPTALPHR
jgi:hypothetical protein